MTFDPLMSANPKGHIVRSTAVHFLSVMAEVMLYEAIRHMGINPNNRGPDNRGFIEI